MENDAAHVRVVIGDPGRKVSAGAREDYWSIQIDNYEARKDLILRFISWGLDERYMTPTESFRITGNEDGTRINFAFQDGGIAEYLKSVTRVTISDRPG